MIKRSRDPEEVVEYTDLYPKAFESGEITLEEWLSEEGNIALVNDKGDAALFSQEEGFPFIKVGHYFFRARGRKAIESGKEFLGEIFSGEHGDIFAVVGATPLEHKGALWMNKKLGFKEHGVIHNDQMLVGLTKEEWSDL